MLKTIQELFELDADDEGYEEVLQRIPETWREKYHYLAMYGAIFIFVLHLGRRASEGVAFLTKAHVEKFTDESTGTEFFKKVLGESSKNHRNDSENLKDGGLILFEPNSFGLNPGQYFNLFLSKSNNDTEFLFSRPRFVCKKFSLKSNPDIWYTSTKIGKNEVQKALPTLCEALGIENITNGQLRPTAIQAMISSGFQDRDIQHVTGHKSAESLKSYAPLPPMSKRFQMTRAISDVGTSSKVDRDAQNEISDYPISSKKLKLSGDENLVPNKSDALNDESDPDEEMLAAIEVIESQSQIQDKDMKLTQSGSKFTASQFLKNEQKIAVQEQELILNQIQLLNEHRKRMQESAKKRHDFAEKYFKKK